MMRNVGAGLIGLLSLCALAGCTTNKSIASISTPAAKLEIAVGTLNDSGGSITGTPGTYLNAVASFRNSLGNSAYQNPGNATMTTPSSTTLYPCGLFSYGQNPLTILVDFINNGPTGNYPNGNTGLNFGLPPTYTPADQNGIGYALGSVYFYQSDCSHFQVPPSPVAGTYTVTAPVPVNGGVTKYAASATLPGSPIVLPNDAAPTFVTDGAGGGTFTVSQPAGVTETLIVIFDTNFAEISTLEATSGTATLPDGTLASGSYNVIAIGADYPLVESGPPASRRQTPTLTGASGTADLTVSAPGPITE